MALDLYHRFYGEVSRPPVVILHGLLGSSRNWQVLAQRLASGYAVWTLDGRNHGQSPHDADAGFPAMAEDLRAFLEAQQLRGVTLVGHSLGGKTAMHFACEYPAYLSRLVVVDIAPKTYPPRWQEEFAALRSIDLDRLNTRTEAEEQLAPQVPDWALRKFLLTNLERTDSGWRWQANLPVLEAALPQLFASGLAPHQQYAGPTRFIRGERSRFLLENDLPAIRHHFPQADLRTVSNAGHNVHFDNPEGFLEAFEA